MGPDVVREVDEGRIVVVDGITTRVFVEEHAVPKEKIAKDQSAYEQKTTRRK